MRLSGILPALALAVVVTALPSGHEPIDSGIEGAKIITGYKAPFPNDEPQWEIQVLPGKKPETFTGTIEDVYAEVLALNPSYLDDFPTENVTLHNTQVEKRDVAGKPLCLDYTDAANNGRIQEGIIYLTNINGWLTIAPRLCARISCSYSAGIAICNDRHDVTWALHTSTITDYVSRTVTECSEFGETAGQQFDTGGFNVITLEMNCNAGSVWNVGIYPP